MRSLEVVNDFTTIARFENMNHINESDSQNNDLEEMETDGGTIHSCKSLIMAAIYLFLVVNYDVICVEPNADFSHSAPPYN